MVSADKAARSARLSTIRNSSMLWILPPRTPIVSTTGTPQAAILLPSHTPPVGFQPIAWPRSAPACLTRSNSASASGVIGLGGRPKPPCASIVTSCSAATAAIDRVDRALRLGLDLGRARAQIDAQHGEVGDDIVGAAAVDPRRIDGQAVAPQPPPSRSARSAAASSALRPSSGLRPAWADRPCTTIAKLPLPGRAPASVPSGRAAGS